MSITEQGRIGETMARTILKDGFGAEIFQPDWMAYKDGTYYVVEVKYKELFQPPPFWGQGLGVRQVRARMKFYKDTGIRCLFLVITKPENETCWQWLDVLEGTKHITTRNGIRIYNINEFTKTSARCNP